MPELFAVRQKLEPGRSGELRERRSEPAETARSNAAEIRDIWEKESLHTLSLFVEHAVDGDYLVWYVEAEDRDQLIEARLSSTSPLHDIEDELMAAVLEDPEEVGNVEPLFHAVSPERPQTFLVESME